MNNKLENLIRDYLCTVFSYNKIDDMFTVVLNIYECDNIDINDTALQAILQSNKSYDEKCKARNEEFLDIIMAEEDIMFDNISSYLNQHHVNHSRNDIFEYIDQHVVMTFEITELEKR